MAMRGAGCGAGHGAENETGRRDDSGGRNGDKDGAGDGDEDGTGVWLEMRLEYGPGWGCAGGRSREVLGVGAGGSCR